MLLLLLLSGVGVVASGEEVEEGAKPPSDAELSAFEKKLRQVRRQAGRRSRLLLVRAAA